MGLKLSGMLISMIIMSMLFIGVSSFVGNLTTSYAIDPGDDYNATFSQMTQTSIIANQVGQSIDNATGTSTDFAGTMQQSTFGGVKQLAGQSGIIYGMGNAVIAKLGLPNLFLIGIMAIITLGLGVVLWQMFIKPFIPI